MTIWIYGDSFVDNKSFEDRTDVMNLHDSWGKIVGNHFNQQVHNFGKCGSSPDYTYHMFSKSRDGIQPNDIVIVAITSIYRRWFFFEKPHQGVIHSFDIFQLEYPKEVSIAIDYYLRYLNENGDLLYSTYLIDFLYNLEYLTKELNLHTIIIPCLSEEEKFLNENSSKFTKFHLAKGNLLNVSRNQYKTPTYEKIVAPYVYDGLTSHFMKSNHPILADKIIRNIENKELIDLDTEFIQNILNKWN